MSDQRPLSAHDRAVMRAMAYWSIDRDQASHLVDHSSIGQRILLGEQMRDLGRALTKPPKWLARRPWGRTAWLLLLDAYLGIGFILLLEWLAKR